MTTLTSTIPALKASLLAVLRERANLADVQVSWGWPQGETQDELIVLLDVNGEQAWAPMGQRHKEETFTLDVFISVLRTGGEQQLATERAFELLAEIEDALRTDVSAGGAVRTAAVQGPLVLGERAQGAKREGALKVGIYCTARI